MLTVWSDRIKWLRVDKASLHFPFWGEMPLGFQASRDERIYYSEVVSQQISNENGDSWGIRHKHPLSIPLEFNLNTWKFESFGVKFKWLLQSGHNNKHNLYIPLQGKLWWLQVRVWWFFGQSRWPPVNVVYVMSYRKLFYSRTFEGPGWWCKNFSMCT